jgi:hypothetical protein
MVTFTGCQSAQMAVPADLQARSEAYPCIGRGGFTLSEHFSFGPYQVENVHRGWTTQTAWGLLFFERSHTRQQYEYSLQGPSGAPWQGQAATGVRKSDLKGTVGGGDLTWGIDSDLNFVVRIGKGKKSSAWTLVLAEGNRDSTLKGHFSDGSTTYRVEGSHKLAGSPMPLMESSGYLIYKGKRPVMAVDVLNAGSVTLDRKLAASKRDPLAAAAAALLLYQDISQD